MYGMTNAGKLFADELTEWLIKEGFMQSQCQMSIYHKYAPDGYKIVVLYYVDGCFYWYTNEDLGKWFVDTLREKIPCELLRICTLVYVSKNFSAEGSFHFCVTG